MVFNGKRDIRQIRGTPDAVRHSIQLQPDSKRRDRPDGTGLLHVDKVEDVLSVVSKQRHLDTRRRVAGQDLRPGQLFEKLAKHRPDRLLNLRFQRAGKPQDAALAIAAQDDRGVTGCTSGRVGMDRGERGLVAGSV
jgi:hypothetical protein